MNTQEMIKRILVLNDESLQVLSERDNPDCQLMPADANRICRDINAEIHGINEKLGTHIKH